MILFFRESTGDYMAVNSASNLIYQEFHKEDKFEARATAIIGLPGSVCSTSVHRKFLRDNCTLVSMEDIPVEWLAAIGLEWCQ